MRFARQHLNHLVAVLCLLCLACASRDPAPPTESPPTESPPTESPPTESPPTESPPLPTAGEGDCGGMQGLACDDGEFCKYDPSAQCGAADQMGTCTPVPEACIQIYQPVCGCDDKTYSNECHAHAAQVSVASEGACGSP